MDWNLFRDYPSHTSELSRAIDVRCYTNRNWRRAQKWCHSRNEENSIWRFIKQHNFQWKYFQHCTAVFAPHAVCEWEDAIINEDPSQAQWCGKWKAKSLHTRETPFFCDRPFQGKKMCNFLVACLLMCYGDWPLPLFCVNSGWHSKIKRLRTIIVITFPVAITEMV